METWVRVVAGAAVIAVALIGARLADRRMTSRQRDPGAETRYRVLRRTVMTAIVVIALFVVLLMIPAVRLLAAGLLASSAVLGLILGLAAQRTLGNFVAGLVIAFTQPLRLGDLVEVDGEVGTVEEIRLTYTFIRLEDNSRLVIPNEKLASDTIRNSTIVSREKVAEVTLQVPLSNELEGVLESLRRETAGDRDAEVFVSALDGNATITLRARASDEAAAERLEAELRLRAHERLRAEGLYA